MTQKIDRSAFLYLPPKAPANKFAQCGTCALFLPGYQRCAVHGSQFEVKADDSCGFYMHGQPSDQQRFISMVTPQDSGFVREQVRCENCVWFKSHCELYKMLNSRLSQVFQLDPEVDKHGCCNAWTGDKPG